MTDTAPLAAPAAKTRHSKLVVGLMLIIILGPMLFAWVLYLKGNRQQLRLSNHGNLITPPPSITHLHFFDPKTRQPFAPKSFQGKWWIAYVGAPLCYQECQNTLYSLRQLRLALGKDQSRLERLYIPHPHCPTNVCESLRATLYPDMQHAALNQEEFEALFAPLYNPVGTQTQGALYLIDPQGYLIMHYPVEIETKDILSDLKRLLKVSKIG